MTGDPANKTEDTSTWPIRPVGHSSWPVSRFSSVFRSPCPPSLLHPPLAHHVQPEQLARAVIDRRPTVRLLTVSPTHRRSRRSLMKEYKDLTADPLQDTITAGPISEDNMLEWEALIQGPEDTPYVSDMTCDAPLAPPSWTLGSEAGFRDGPLTNRKAAFSRPSLSSCVPPSLDCTDRRSFAANGTCSPSSADDSPPITRSTRSQ